MGTKKLFFLITSVLHLVSDNTAGAQRLTAELCSAKLPTACSTMASLYDGDDTIYLFGGVNDNFINQTLKYSISEDRIESIGYLPGDNSLGAAVVNKFKNIFYFQGRNNKDIFQYFPATQTFEKMSSFEKENVGRAVVKSDADTALIVGAWDLDNMTVTSLNLNTLESEAIASHPINMRWIDPTAIWSEKNDMAYIFMMDDTVTYSPTNNQFTRLEEVLPFYGDRDGVSDGRYFYLFGTMNNGPGLILFDPEVNEMRYIEVDNKPHMDSLAPVYVPRLNGIYLFGGYILNGSYMDEIYYIDLDPMNEVPTTTENSPITTMDPDIFNCMGRPDAVYPYPGDCGKFIICREDHGYPFNCPEPLLFHPVNRQCTWPDWVNCNEDPQF